MCADVDAAGQAGAAVTAEAAAHCRGDDGGDVEDQLTVPCRALIVGKVDSSDKLRRLDELLEVARAKLIALTDGRHHARTAGPSAILDLDEDRQSSAMDDGASELREAGAHASGAAGVADGGGGSNADGDACDLRLEGDREEVAAQRDVLESGRSIGGGDSAGADAVLRQEAKVVAEILQHVGEASALVQGDLAERLHTTARRCAQCGTLNCLWSSQRFVHVFPHGMELAEWIGGWGGVTWLWAVRPAVLLGLHARRRAPCFSCAAGTREEVALHAGFGVYARVRSPLGLTVHVTSVCRGALC